MPVSDFTPSTVDVASVLMARTRDSLGNLHGDFITGTTSVSTEQATAAISEAADEVGEAVAADLPPDLQAAAKRATILLAAANIEMSYFPEQAAANNSMYDKLMKRYETLLGRVQGDYTEEEEEQESDSNQLWPTGDFPEPSGWDSVRW